MAIQSGARSAGRLLGGGTDGNERLTAATGVALALIPQYGPWLHYHPVLGG